MLLWDISNYSDLFQSSFLLQYAVCFFISYQIRVLLKFLGNNLILVYYFVLFIENNRNKNVKNYITKLLILKTIFYCFNDSQKFCTKQVFILFYYFFGEGDRYCKLMNKINISINKEFTIKNNILWRHIL